MWIKKYADGSSIQEDALIGNTWLKTNNKNIVEVFMVNAGQKSPSLIGYKKYWHSRTGAVLQNNGAKNTVLSERIQGLRPDGKWDTIEWDVANKKYIRLVLDKALGMPVIKG